MKKKDVLILCQFFYPEYVSSATLPYEMAEDFVKANMSVDVLCGYPKQYTDANQVVRKEMVNGINIQRVKYVQLNSKKNINRLINYFSFLVGIASRFYKLKKYKTVIVYSNPPLLPIIPAVFKRIFKINVVFVSYDIYPEVAILLGATTKDGLIDKITTKVNEIVFKNVSKVVAISEEMKEYLLNNRKYLTPDKVEVIHNWYEDKAELIDEVIYNEHFRKIKQSNKTVIVYTGNMGMAQDMETIYQAAKTLNSESSIQFMLVGHGCKLLDLQQRAKEENIKNIEFHEFLRGTDFTDVLKIASAYVVSLEKGVEALGVPSKTYSYMAVGRPLLAIMSDNTDIVRNINSYNLGFSLKQGEVSKLVDAIMQIRDDKELVSEMSQNCRRVYENNYTRKICVTKYIEMINKL